MQTECNMAWSTEKNNTFQLCEYLSKLQTIFKKLLQDSQNQCKRHNAVAYF